MPSQFKGNFLHCSVGIAHFSIVPGVSMNNLLSSCCDPLPSNTTLCFGAWIQGESVGGWPFNCEGIVISPTVSFFAAHKAVPDLQGGCFYRVDIPEACLWACWLV